MKYSHQLVNFCKKNYFEFFVSNFLLKFSFIKKRNYLVIFCEPLSISLLDIFLKLKSKKEGGKISDFFFFVFFSQNSILSKTNFVKNFLFYVLSVRYKCLSENKRNLYVYILYDSILQLKKFFIGLIELQQRLLFINNKSKRFINYNLDYARIKMNFIYCYDFFVTCDYFINFLASDVFKSFFVNIRIISNILFFLIKIFLYMYKNVFFIIKSFK